MTKPTAELWIKVNLPGVGQIGPGKINLLRQIRTQESISGAARAMKMSYRRAWLLVDTMNRCFHDPVVEAEAGGERGGGTHLTALGEEVVRRYRASERLAEQAAAAELRALRRLLR
jgi:molybdate transport system regulatory protein